jgi:hypothetical protein
MTDEHGAVAIPGFCDDVGSRPRPSGSASPGWTSTRRRSAPTRACWTACRSPAIPELHPLERLWMQPSATIIGIDAPCGRRWPRTPSCPPHGHGSASAWPRARTRAGPASCASGSSARPTRPEITVTPGAAAAAFTCDPAVEPSRSVFEAADAALEAAYGAPVVYTGVGGTIPFIAPFAAAFGTDGAPPRRCSPASRTPTPGRTASTSPCTSATGATPASVRPTSSPPSPIPPARRAARMTAKSEYDAAYFTLLRAIEERDELLRYREFLDSERARLDAFTEADAAVGRSRWRGRCADRSRPPRSRCSKRSAAAAPSSSRSCVGWTIG